MEKKQGGGVLRRGGAIFRRRVPLPWVLLLVLLFALSYGGLLAAWRSSVPLSRVDGKYQSARLAEGWILDAWIDRENGFYLEWQRNGQVDRILEGNVLRLSDDHSAYLLQDTQRGVGTLITFCNNEFYYYDTETESPIFLHQTWQRSWWSAVYYVGSWWTTVTS